jgi:hypothetical protein
VDVKKKKTEVKVPDVDVQGANERDTN